MFQAQDQPKCGKEFVSLFVKKWNCRIKVCFQRKWKKGSTLCIIIAPSIIFPYIANYYILKDFPYANTWEKWYLIGLTHFCIRVIVECIVLTARTNLWVLYFVNMECITNTQITVSCKYSQILWDKGYGVYVSSLFRSQTVSCKYPIIIILSSGKVTLLCHENSCYYCAFLFLACAEEEPLILDETHEELV